MARRRRKKIDEFDLAKLIVGAVFLLSYAYTKNLKTAFQLGVIFLVVGGALFGLVLYLRRSDRSGSFASGKKSVPVTRKSKNLPASKLEQEFYQQFRRPAISKMDKPVEWSLELIRSLDWKCFEDLCAGYFQAKGRRAKVTNLGADGGVDVLLYGDNDPEKILGVVQCKAWMQKPVGVREVRELLGVMTDVGCPLGVYVATSGYTPDAKAFADGKHIKLIDAEQLLALIQVLPVELRAELLQKTTTADYTTPSCPSCGIKLVTRISSKGNNAGQSFWGCSNFPRYRYTIHRAKSA